MNKVAIVALALAVAGGVPVATKQDRPVYQDRTVAVDKRADDLVARMTLEEKVVLLGGDRTGFATQGIERLGTPAMTMTDGPVGVRFEKATAFPAGVAMAATWDPDLIGRVATAIGEEAKAHGRDVLLGPCVNIQRVPQGGRNFESFGEDPYLAARMAVAYGHYPGQDETVEYGEGVFVGYRHFDRANIEPRFPFGHGLSYTTFTYANLVVTAQVALSDVRAVTDDRSVASSGLHAGTGTSGRSVVGSGLQAGTSDRRQPGVIQVSFDVQNTGRREGAEVAQINVSPAAPSVPRPPKELKAFQRVVLKPGARQAG